MYRSVLVVGATLVACGGGSDAPEPDAFVASDACVATSPWVAYLHRGGGTYTGGMMPDSSTNTTPIFFSQTATLAPPTIVEQEWPDYVACVESKFAPFNVSITTTDPGAASHLEIVLVDRADQVGAPVGANMLAPASECRGGRGLVTERGIALVMWETLGNTGARCQKTAQAIGYLLGLDRALACTDIMAWDTALCVPNGDATFVDAEVPCGETEARMCQCGFPTENTFRHLELVTSQCPR